MTRKKCREIMQDVIRDSLCNGSFNRNPDFKLFYVAGNQIVNSVKPMNFLLSKLCIT